MTIHSITLLSIFEIRQEEHQQLQRYYSECYKKLMISMW